MIDLSGFRPFRLSDFAPAFTPGMYQAGQLIQACQIKHLGFVDGRPVSRGARALAMWIVAHGDLIHAPKPASHPFNSGTAIERIIAGELLPEEAFAVDLAQATEGAVLPEMFGLHDLESAASGTLTPCPGVAGKPLASASNLHGEPHGEPHGDAAPAASLAVNLPPMGVLGGALPGGRLFHPIADSRLPHGFLLAGAGLMIGLDESMATAMRDTLNEGLAHIAKMRGETQSARVAA